MNSAIGLLEVKSLSGSILVLDAMMKTADVSFVDIKKDMGGGLVTIVVSGPVGGVEAAVSAGAACAARMNALIAKQIMANPDPQTVMYLDGSYRKQRIPVRREACGILEVYGFVCAMSAADAAVKAANVRIVGIERTKGTTGIELIVAVKVAGLPDAVGEAVLAGLRAAARVGDVISSHTNALPDAGIDAMIGYTNLKSD